MMVRMLVGMIPGLATPLAHLLDDQGLPDVLLPARVLDKRGGRAEGGEGEGCVFAGVLVRVVAAHLSFYFIFWCFFLVWM